jgi:hypothetical protein
MKKVLSKFFRTVKFLQWLVEPILHLDGFVLISPYTDISLCSNGFPQRV